jgi:hypothetical protein
MWYVPLCCAVLCCALQHDAAAAGAAGLKLGGLLSVFCQRPSGLLNLKLLLLLLLVMSLIDCWETPCLNLPSNKTLRAP